MEAVPHATISILILCSPSLLINAGIQGSYVKDVGGRCLGWEDQQQISCLCLLSQDFLLAQRPARKILCLKPTNCLKQQQTTRQQDQEGKIRTRLRHYNLSPLRPPIRIFQGKRSNLNRMPSSKNLLRLIERCTKIDMRIIVPCAARRLSRGRL